MANDKAQKIIVIVGPTASGKSDLAIKIAQKISAIGGPASGWNGAEIISADSRQVYRRLDIGTGKVPRDKIKKLRIANYVLKTNTQPVIRNKLIWQYYAGGIRHHLIDVVSPKKQFTADDFKRLGEKAIKDITSRRKIPIIVGGTGFYIDVLLGRMTISGVPPNKKLRTKLAKHSVEQLFKRLQKLDPQRAKTIEPKNKRRLIRTLEIVITTGKPVPFFATSSAQGYGRSKKASKGKPKYSIFWLGLRPNNLEKKIKSRLDKRLRQGMVREVKNLRKQGVSWKRLDDFGLEYRWISRWLKNNPQSVIRNTQFKNSKEYRNLLRDIIKYSKRQMTWFKRNKEIRWLAPTCPEFGRGSEVEGVKNRKETEKLLQSFL